MLQTKNQVLSAISEIRSITGWRDAEIARKAGINKSTITRLKSDNDRQPSGRVKQAIYNVLLMARGLGQ